MISFISHSPRIMHSIILSSRFHESNSCTVVIELVELMTMSKRKVFTYGTLYATFRPHYPQEIYHYILSFCQSEGGDAQNDLAVDVACGTGNSTLLLCSHFKKVIGVDLSQQQVDTAHTKHTNLEFHVAPAENLSFIKDRSVDLITCAQALHWFDRPRFYKEVDRLLKPSGVLAVYGYGRVGLDNHEASQVVLKVIQI